MCRLIPVYNRSHSKFLRRLRFPLPHLRVHLFSLGPRNAPPVGSCGFSGLICVSPAPPPMSGAAPHPRLSVSPWPAARGSPTGLPWPFTCKLPPLWLIRPLQTTHDLLLGIGKLISSLRSFCLPTRRTPRLAAASGGGNTSICLRP